MTKPAFATPELQQLHELVRDQRVTMLTTQSPDGELTSRPMTVIAFNPPGHFWFFVEHDPADAAFELRHRQCNLAFSNESASTFVSVVGQGQVLHDPSLAQTMWTAMARPWFPQGPDSPNLGLLRVTPVSAEYWNAPDSKVLRGLALVASIAAAKPVGLGSHGVLDTTR